MIQLERTNLELLLKNPESVKAGKSGLNFLDYLDANWMAEDLWLSWSQRGKNDAAERLNIPITDVLPTTNHLESFNGVLKLRHVAHWKHSGTRLRFDVLILHLIRDILPYLFARLRVLFRFHEWKGVRFQEAAGGVDLMLAQKMRLNHQTMGVRTLAWFSVDDARDKLATEILKSGRLHPIASLRPYELWATCSTSIADPHDINHNRYWLTIHLSGAATCTCPDWLQRAGACKHLRAFKQAIEAWVQNGAIDTTYLYQFPSTREAAENVLERNLTWYGSHYSSAVTFPVDLPAGQCHMSNTPPATMIMHENAPIVPAPSLPPAHCLDNDPAASHLIEVEEELQELALGMINQEIPDDQKSDSQSMPSTPEVCVECAAMSF